MPKFEEIVVSEIAENEVLDFANKAVHITCDVPKNTVVRLAGGRLQIDGDVLSGALIHVIVDVGPGPLTFSRAGNQSKNHISSTPIRQTASHNASGNSNVITQIIDLEPEEENKESSEQSMNCLEVSRAYHVKISGTLHEKAKVVTNGTAYVKTLGNNSTVLAKGTVECQYVGKGAVIKILDGGGPINVWGRVRHDAYLETSNAPIKIAGSVGANAQITTTNAAIHAEAVREGAVLETSNACITVDNNVGDAAQLISTGHGSVCVGGTVHQEAVIIGKWLDLTENTQSPRPGL